MDVCVKILEILITIIKYEAEGFNQIIRWELQIIPWELQEATNRVVESITKVVLRHLSGYIGPERDCIIIH